MREQISEVQSDQTQSDMLLEVRHLKKYFPVYSKGIVKKAVGNIKAVDDVSFQLKRGEVLGLVGESGCGKSTIGKTILRLVEPTDGEIIVDGKDFRKLNKKELRLKRRDLQMIFQDPYSSLDARMTARQTIEEAMIIHNLGDRESMKKKGRLSAGGCRTCLLSCKPLSPGIFRRTAPENWNRPRACCESQIDYLR